MGENDLDQALQILIDSGLPEEQAIQLKQFLIQPQGGPGDTNQNLSGAGAPVGAKAVQGQMPQAEVQRGA
jgi:hypothetical protein